MKSTTKTLIAAMRVLAVEIQSGDGVANGAIAEAADRLQEMDAERDGMRRALLWNAAALQACCKSGAVTEQDEFIADSGALTAREILDMADAALAQEHTNVD